jgi:hypothetical protein
MQSRRSPQADGQKVRYNNRIRFFAERAFLFSTERAFQTLPLLPSDSLTRCQRQVAINRRALTERQLVLTSRLPVNCGSADEKRVSPYPYCL